MEAKSSELQLVILAAVARYGINYAIKTYEKSNSNRYQNKEFW